MLAGGFGSSSVPVARGEVGATRLGLHLRYRLLSNPPGAPAVLQASPTDAQSQRHHEAARQIPRRKRLEQARQCVD